jgi:hypothetical protein
MVALHFYHAIFGRAALPAGSFKLFTQSGWLQSGQMRPVSVE